MSRQFHPFVLLMAALVLLAACGGPTATPAPTVAPTQPPPTVAPTVAPTQPPATPTPTPLSGSISVAGSTTVQPLAEELAKAFIALNPGVKIDVQGGGSSVGIKSAGQGTVDIGTASREIKDSERAEFPDLKIFTIALDGIAVVVHPQVGVDDLTVEQVRDIFGGKITNWKEVGGPDKPIVVVSREEGAGTRGAFEEMVMGGVPIAATAILQTSSGAVRTTVATTPDSIGYISFGYLDVSVKVLKINGVEATTANVLNKSYPIVRPLNMLTKGDPQGVVKAWLDWILGPQGQEVVSKNYIPVR